MRKVIETIGGLVLILLPICIYAYWIIAPRQFPKTAPQYVKLKEEPLLSDADVKINNMEMNLKEWRIALNKPRAHFEGADEIRLSNTAKTEGDPEVLIQICTPYESKILNMEIQFGKDTYYLEKEIDIPNLICIQGDKRIHIKGKIELSEISMRSRNGNIITLSINGPTINLNSELIYEWTGKGGPTYRL